jgi:hypothetical protein
MTDPIFVPFICVLDLVPIEPSYQELTPGPVSGRYDIAEGFRNWLVVIIRPYHNFAPSIRLFSGSMSDMEMYRQFPGNYTELKAVFDVTALVPELKPIFGGIGSLSIGQRLSRLSKASRNYPLQGVVRWQIVNFSHVPHDSH